jgi:Tim17/Tim22/Tim23/Pmp24 family
VRQILLSLTPRPSLATLSLTLFFAGIGIGAFFSLMSASFAYEDPLLRQQTQAGMGTGQKAREVFREMGKGMWRSGKGFGKVGALFAGIECVIESVGDPFFFARTLSTGFFFSVSTALKTISTTLWRLDLSLAGSWRGIRVPRVRWVEVWPLRRFQLLSICSSSDGRHRSEFSHL